MKRAMTSMLILTALGFWIPTASAEISKDLDPMVSSEPQATVTSERPAGATVTGQTGPTASAVGTVKEEKKTEEAKKKKAKKSSAKKPSSKKSGKSNSKKPKVSKNSSY